VAGVQAKELSLTRKKSVPAGGKPLDLRRGTLTGRMSFLPEGKTCLGDNPIRNEGYEGFSRGGGGAPWANVFTSVIRRAVGKPGAIDYT